MPRKRSVAAFVLLAFVLGACSTLAGREVSADREAHGALATEVASIVDPLIEADLAATGAPGAAFVYVHAGRIIYSRGYGVSDLVGRHPVDPATTVWPVASITKTVTALAVLQLVDRGLVDLDTDINHYLRRFQVPSQGYPPLTLRHLLSHTGGLDELPGRQFDGVGRPDMAAFLREHIVRYRAPGVRTAYSTYGIMLAAAVLEDVTGQSYADYANEHIFRPAGLSRARIMRGQGDERGVATPYDLADGVARPRAFEWYVSAPTSSMAASADDMGRLLLVHLSSGRAGRAQILSPAGMQLMHAQQAGVHPRVPGWSLGMQMDVVNGRSIAEHGGDIGGFSALFVVLPGEDTGFFIVSHGEGGDLRFRVKQALMDGRFPDPMPPAVPAARSEDAPRLSVYAGRYISSLACRSCDDAGDNLFTVEANGDGSLALWGQRWIPFGRDLFIRDDGQRLLGFARDDDGAVAALSAGSWRVADRVG